MAKYTLELRHLVEFYGREEVENWFKDYDVSDYLDTEQIDTIASKGVWSKDKLATKIVEHYWFKEIGFETSQMFCHFVKSTMKEIMEEKLLYIYANAIKYDPLSTINYTETFESESEGNAENTGTSNSNSKNNATGISVSSDTPQGQIDKKEVLQGKYATNVNANQSDGTVEDTTQSDTQGTVQNKEKWTRTKKGDDAVITTNQYLIEQYRKIVRAVDKEIIEELNNLFIGLF